MRYGSLRVKEVLGFLSGTYMFQAMKFGGDFFSAKFLGPDLWGEWYFIYTLVTFSTLLAFGNINGSVLLIPQYYGEGNKSKYEIISKFTIGFTILLATLLIVLFFVTNFFIEGVFPYVFLASAAFILYTMTNGMLRSFSFFNHISLGLLIMSMMYIMLPASAYFYGSLELFAIVFFVVYFTGASLLSAKLKILTFGSLRSELSTFSQNKKLISDTFRLGLPIAITGLSFLLYTSIDRLLIKYYFDDVELGYYSIAIMLLSGVLMIPKTIAQMIYPRMSNSWGKYGNVKGMRYWIKKSKNYAIISIIPITIILYLLTPYLIEFFLPKYIVSIQYIKMLLLSGPAYIIIMGYGNALNVLKRQKNYLYIIISSIVFNLIVSLSIYYVNGSSLAFAIGTVLAYYYYALTLHFYTQMILKKLKAQ